MVFHSKSAFGIIAWLIETRNVYETEMPLDDAISMRYKRGVAAPRLPSGTGKCLC